MHRSMLTILTTLSLAVAAFGQVAPDDEAPARGVTVVVTGRAPCVPDVLEVRTTVTGVSKTATGAQKKFHTKLKRVLEELSKLPASKTVRDRTEIDPPRPQTNSGQQIFLGGGVIVGGVLVDGSGTGNPKFTARQRLIVRREGIADLEEAERLSTLAKIVDVLKKAKLPLGDPAPSSHGHGNIVVWNAVGAAAVPPTVAEEAPPPPIRFSSSSAAAEAAATASALAEARRVATTLATLSGRKLGKATTVEVMRSTPPPPGSAKGGDHVVEMKVVFELR